MGRPGLAEGLQTFESFVRDFEENSLPGVRQFYEKRRLPEGAQVDDIMQETWLRIVRHIENSEHRIFFDKRFNGYVSVTIKNVVKELWRKSNAKKRKDFLYKSLDDLRERGRGLEDWRMIRGSVGLEQEPDVNPFLMAVAKEQYQRIELQCRDEQERKILHLVVDGLNNVKIGKELHISEKTVRRYVGHIQQCCSELLEAA